MLCSVSPGNSLASSNDCTSKFFTAPLRWIKVISHLESRATQNSLPRQVPPESRLTSLSTSLGNEEKMLCAVKTFLIKNHHYIAEVRLKANEKLASIWNAPPTRKLFNCSWRWCFTAALKALNNSCRIRAQKRGINLDTFVAAAGKAGRIKLFLMREKGHKHRSR